MQILASRSSRLLYAAAGALIACLSVAACSPSEEQSPPPPPAGVPTGAPGGTPTASTGGGDGASLFARTCGGCHGPDGKKPAGGHVIADEVASLGRAGVIKAMEEGPGPMPAFRSGPQALSEADFNAIVDHVMSLGK